MCRAYTFGSIAGVLQSEGRLSEVEAYAERSRKMLQDRWGMDSLLWHPPHVLAQVYVERGQFGRAAVVVRELESMPGQCQESRASIKGLSGQVLVEKGTS